MSAVVELTNLDAAAAATIVGWVCSAQELALVAGPNLQWPLTAEQLLDSGQARSLRVLRDDGAPVAFGTARVAPGSVRLGWILVDPARRGEGWGRELLTRLIADARQQHGPVTLSLAVFAHNQPALQLYRSLGFNEQPPVPSDVAGLHWHKIEMELPPPAAQP